MVSLHNENAILSTKMDSHLTNQEKERMGLNFDNDGEWWMSYRLTTSNIFGVHASHMMQSIERTQT